MTTTPSAAAKKKATFNTLTVSEVRALTEDSVEVSFAIPPELQDDYDYIPGQYVALRATIDGQEVRRSYSICDVPRDGVLRVAIKRDRGGVFSTWANDTLQPGDTMDVMNPQGAFTSKTHLTGLNNPEAVREELEKLENPHLVAIAAGSGITPIMAIAQTVLHSSPTPHSSSSSPTKAAVTSCSPRRLVTSRTSSPRALPCTMSSLASSASIRCSLGASTLKNSRPCWITSCARTTSTNGSSAAPSSWCSWFVMSWPAATWAKRMCATSCSPPANLWGSEPGWPPRRGRSGRR